MIYEPSQLHKDVRAILARYGERKQQGFYTVSQLRRGVLAILTIDPLNDTYSIIFAGTILDMENLPMKHPATEFILNLAIECDEYYQGKASYNGGAW